ncbi:hypothetical protein L6164_029497 [Bauhinia variegata]|uniref:Uncharacterized protein n=1 Tax=Bauhinia variegata TaxID=167791 RepID=A0ACB9L9T0_BAUVA|nr:hypothetical protein L6164_029497 [Bauhinia variegata]
MWMWMVVPEKKGGFQNWQIVAGCKLLLVRKLVLRARKVVKLHGMEERIQEAKTKQRGNLELVEVIWWNLETNYREESAYIYIYINKLKKKAYKLKRTLCI